jgi:hypothetical protein
VKRDRGQAAILAAILIPLLVLVVCGLIDVYHAEDMRGWGYRVAQQAAMAGVSHGRVWNNVEPALDPNVPTPDPEKGECADPPLMYLDAADAYDSTLNRLRQEMVFRGVATYAYDIRVIPDALGGSEENFPPDPVRLGNNRGHWQTTRPAVGVFLSFPADTWLLSFIGIRQLPIYVFSAAEVVQPPLCPPQP